jgi:hypothetical protein
MCCCAARLLERYDCGLRRSTTYVIETFGRAHGSVRLRLHKNVISQKVTGENYSSILYSGAMASKFGGFGRCLCDDYPNLTIHKCTLAGWLENSRLEETSTRGMSFSVTKRFKVER